MIVLAERGLAFQAATRTAFISWLLTGWPVMLQLAIALAWGMMTMVIICHAILKIIGRPL